MKIRIGAIKIRFAGMKLTIGARAIKSGLVELTKQIDGERFAEYLTREVHLPVGYAEMVGQAVGPWLAGEFEKAEID